jgi:hypothetical protein
MPLRAWIDDARLDQITANHLRQFLIWLRTDYQLHRVTGTQRPLSNKTIHNIYMFLVCTQKLRAHDGLHG